MSRPTPADPAPRPWVATVAVLGVVGVLVYVAAWAVGGVIWAGYDPTRQAISELFAIGAPAATRVLLSAGLVASGLGLVAFGWAMDVGLPGRGRAGPVLAIISGVMTVAVVAVPCTAGCPGYGTTLTDTLHVLTAGTGYVTLMLAPLAMGWRLRDHLPGLARAGAVLGGGALVVFVGRSVGLGSTHTGLEQRIFNTAADAWYVIAAVVIVRRAWVRSPSAPGRGPRRTEPR